MNYSEIVTIALKEMRDLARDTPFLVLMILLPMVSYPCILVCLMKSFDMRVQQTDAHITHVLVAGNSSSIRRIFQDRKSISLREAGVHDGTRALELGKADVVVEIPPDFDQQLEHAQQSPTIVAVYDEMKDFFVDRRRVSSALDELRAAIRTKRLTSLGMSDTFSKSLHFKRIDVATTSERSGAFVALSFPITIILIILIATLFPALDLVAGERQRGSLEPLLASAASRRNLIYGKLLSLCAFGLITSVLTLASTLVTLNFAATTAHDLSGSFPLQVSPVAVLLSLPLLLPMIVVLGAIALSISAYASNFQQGAGYGTPYILVALILSLVSLVPLKHLPFAIYLVPVANAAVCIKALFTQELNWVGFGVTLASSSLCAWYLSLLTVDLLTKEETLFKTQVSPARQRDFGRHIAGLYVVAFMLMFYAGQFTLLLNVFWGILFTQLVAVVLPSLAMLKWLRQPFLETLSWRRTSVKMLLGAPLLAPGLVLLGGGMEVLQNAILPMPEMYQKMFTDLIIPKGQPLWATLVAVAAAPGICEEIMFRGVILGLLRKRWPPLPCCAVVALLFGLFHLSGYRLVPTAIIGFVLALLVFRSGSIFPSMLLHAFNNGLSVLSVAYSWKVETPAVIIGASVSTLVGCWLIFYPRQPVPGFEIEQSIKGG